MKLSTSLVCLLLVFSVQLMGNEKKTVSSKLNEATVFFRGAELSHTATANLIKGENEIYVEGLSPKIDINSLKIKSPSGVVVSSYEYTVDYLTDSKPSTVWLKNIEDSIGICQDKLDKIEIDRKINANMLKYLQDGISKNISGSEKGLGIDDLVKTIDYYKNKSLEAETLLKSLEKQKTMINETLSRLKSQLNQEKTKGNKTSGVLKLNLSASRPVAGTFVITYFTGNAMWVPYYDINVESIDKPIKITQKSKVSQTTGIDWSKVKLTLSTSYPSNGKVAPLFSAWFLRQIQVLPSPSISNTLFMQNSISYKKEMIMADQSVEEEKMEPSMSDYITETDNALNLIYNIDLPYTIPGNGKEQNIELLVKETPAEYKYYCAPKLDRESYLLAEISGWEKLGLLSANANITYDGTYIGETYIDANSTHEKLPLTLGTDRRVVVKREKMTDYSSKKSMGSDIQQVITYKLTVKNNQNKSIKMILKEQYPISTQKKIEVELLKDTTPWTANKEDVGVVTWEGDFKPGETKTYQFSYSVKYPKDMNLNL